MKTVGWPSGWVSITFWIAATEPEARALGRDILGLIRHFPDTNEGEGATRQVVQRATADMLGRLCFLLLLKDFVLLGLIDWLLPLVTTGT